MKVVSNSNPMYYILVRRLIIGQFTQWIIILQEFDLEFSAPKTMKGLPLAEFIIDFPMVKIEPPINETMWDEHLFLIITDDSLYRDILTYLHTKKFAPHLTRGDRRCIHHQEPCYLLIGDVFYQWGVETILHRCLIHDEVEHVLNDCHVGSCGDHLPGMATT